MKKNALIIVLAIVFTFVLLYSTASSRKDNRWTLFIYSYGNSTTDARDIFIEPGIDTETKCQKAAFRHGEFLS